MTKYLPSPTITFNAKLIQLPFGLSKYDIESADNNPKILDLLMEEECIITEKMEGSNFSISVKNDEVYVNQRRYSIEPTGGEEHLWWKTAKKTGLYEYCQKLGKLFPNTAITLYGELCGPAVQGNIYKLKESRIFLFDLKVNDKWADYDIFNGVAIPFEQCPIVFVGRLKDFLNNRSVREASNGESFFGGKREGMVIKPLKEMYEQKFGRVIIKQRSPEYLAESEN